MNAQELQTLCQIALAAGREVMAVYRDGGQTWQKEDQSPLTEADLRADRVIRAGLEQHFAGAFVLSEESVSAGARDTSRFFLVDPLDGTKEFVQRNGEFTVNIAWVVDGRPVAGVVFAPALDELFYAAQGVGAFKRDAQGREQAIATAGTVPGGVLRVMGSRSHGGAQLQAWLDGLQQAHSFVAAGSSLKFCRVAEGAADVYPRFGPTSQWDTAAAQAVLEVAGGVVSDMQGQGLRYGLNRSVRNPPFVALAQAGLYAQLF